MNTDRFGHITRFFAAHASRRAVVGSAIATGVSAGLASRAVMAQDDAPVASPVPADRAASDMNRANPEFLFAQAFTAGSWAPKAGDDGMYELTLTGLAAQTWYFSDRPDRIFGLAPTEQFLDGLGFTPDNPPNAALVAAGPGGNEAVLIIELLNPTYDTAVGTVTYDARVLSSYDQPELSHAAIRQVDPSLPEQFGPGGLFIDDCPGEHAICTNLSTGEEVGRISIGMCWDWSLVSCQPCYSQYDMSCARAYPDQCATTAVVDGTTVPASLCSGKAWGY